MGKALHRAPSTITPPPWGVTAISYKKMIQPIFEKNCATFHMGDGKGREKLDLTAKPSGAMRGQFSEPYLTLLGSSAYSVGGHGAGKKNYAGGFDVSWGRSAWQNDGPMRTFKPMTFFSYNSLLLNTLKDGKHNKVKLSPDELRLLTTWIDCNTPYRDGEELRQTPDPIFSGIEMIPVRPKMQNAPVIMRP